MELNDELLCAYLDGELDAARRDGVTAALEKDAGARLRLDRMRTADERLRAEITVPGLASDDPLAQQILRDEEPRARGLRASRAPAWWSAGLTLAAGICGIVIGLVLSTARDPVAPAVARGSVPDSLTRTLENTLSGSSGEADRASAAVLLTVKTKEGRYCRLFRTSEPDGVAEGVACRKSGVWRVVAWDATVTDSASFRPAGASGSLDAVLDGLGGTTLTSEDEQSLIQGHWPESVR